jgi:hypothetical protein
MLKDGYVSWRSPLSASIHLFSVSASIPKRDAEFRLLLSEFCDLWNADQGIRDAGPCVVEVTLSSPRADWIGCSTADDILCKAQLGFGRMRVFDCSDLLKQAQRAQVAAARSEKERRVANPVLDPITLPRTIKSEIARYLRLEYGEGARDEKRVKATDLQFEGEIIVDGVPTQFWLFPTSRTGEKRWATVERFKDSYTIGMTAVKPNSSNGSRASES